MTPEEYDALPRTLQRLYRQATKAGIEAAEAWMRWHPRCDWEAAAASPGSSHAFTTHPWWGDNSLFGPEVEALQWYDRAFRNRLDEALDDDHLPA